MPIKYQGQDEDKKKFKVYKIIPISYTEFDRKLPRNVLESVGTEFDVESSIVHQILYQTSEGKIRSVIAARVDDLALHPLVAASYKRGNAQVIANTPIVSDEEYSTLVDIYAFHEASKLLRSYNSVEIGNILKIRKIYNEEISERIRSFLPKPLEEIVSEEEKLNKQIAPTISRCEKLLVKCAA